MFERIFALKSNNTSIKKELLAGSVTFFTMSYIIFLQPAILSGNLFGNSTGMDAGALTTATILAASISTIFMGLYARLPVALAPGMGENFFFALTIIPAAASAGFTEPWKTALGTIFVSGVVFFIFTVTGARVPPVY
jgi:AGZA family xanthine/uracil permease-like MFS transporter